MKPFLLLFSLLVYTVVQAQTASSKIMDANVDWTNSGSGGVYGHIKIFLADTVGLTGLTVKYGSTDTSTNYFSGTYTIPGSFTSSGCTTDNNNVLTIPMGSRSQSVIGHLRISLTFAGGGANNMDILK